ncbi:hypothetical protein O6H91_18G050200 [Diphasiastrum complanatum]|uniref:Uncharacterized protein n=2 Tax=Diphasiastrum complanatum TaxID=34168 RepID=A0ACC2B0X6_DIPCM|nr:hypothetical protein O6H91_18G050200 [Diphasiastrum complanatum]KAJ7523412.1 hypothetical protein O6H91_18G050200 [Diphasiastrum complanatum]
MANAIGNASRRLTGLRPSNLLRNPSLNKLVSSSSLPASPKRLHNNATAPRILRHSPCSKRLLGELGCMESLIPWHSATSAARLVSRISNNVTTFYEGNLANYVSPI